MVSKMAVGVDCFFIPNGKNFNSETFSAKDDNENFTSIRKGLGSSIFGFGLYSQ